MAALPKTYTRLTRNSAGIGSYSSLWLAADHLMIVRSTGYSESYVRVQLRDIKAILLAKTLRRAWWGGTWGFIATVSAVMVSVALSTRSTPIFSAIFLALSLGALLWNHLRGPGCRAYVVTGVQTAELPSLTRMKQARGVALLKLEPLIMAAQADLRPAAVPSAEVPLVILPSVGDAAANPPPPTTT